MAITINFGGMTADEAGSLARELTGVGERVTVGGRLKGVCQTGGEVLVELCLDDEVTVVLGAAPPDETPDEAAAPDSPPTPNYDLN